MSKRKKIQNNLEFFLGIITLIISNSIGYIAFGIIYKKIPDSYIQQWIMYFALLLVSFVIVHFYFSSHINLLKRSKSMEFTSTFRDCIFTYALFGTLLILTKNEIIKSRYLFVSSFIGYFVLQLIGRYVLKRAFLGRISTSRLATMCGIISTTDRAKEFIPRLQTDWSKDIHGVALIDAVLDKDKYLDANGNEIHDISGVPVVANRENYMGWIRTASLDEIYINIDLLSYEDAGPIVEELEDMGITVHLNIPTMESIFNDSKFNNLACVVKAGYPMAVFTPTVHNESSLVIKRILDIAGGLAGTLISLPIILLTAIPLKIESKGPLIFKQQRVGKNGRIFNIYKLRSMYIDAEERKAQLMEQNKMEGLMFKMDDDPRITRVGKFIRKYSIDELPQFWNVLKGDMSLVGTRPPTIDEFEKYESHHKRRLSMKPGITGKWQVSGRSNIQNFEEIVKLDCEYIDEWSIYQDIKILFKTVKVVLTHEGAE